MTNQCGLYGRVSTVGLGQDPKQQIDVLKSVSYHPDPLSLNDGADISLETVSLLHTGQVLIDCSLNFWIFSN